MNLAQETDIHSTFISFVTLIENVICKKVWKIFVWTKLVFYSASVLTDCICKSRLYRNVSRLKIIKGGSNVTLMCKDNI